MSETSFRGARNLLFWALVIAGYQVVQAQPVTPGADVQTLLTIARQVNPDYASMRHEAQAATERVTSAGALPDPRLRTELMDITKAGEQNPTLWPSDVGSTRYTLMQDIPWFGKRDLKRDIAQFEAESSQGKAAGVWAELAAKIKIAHAQRYYLRGSEALTRELLDLTNRLERVAQVRYAGGLAAQQDVIRAQLEQTSMKTELVAIQSESQQVNARMNALLARPAFAPLAQPERLRSLPATIELDYATLAQRVRTRNPQLFSEEARLKAAEKTRDLTYKNRYPDFTLAISPTQTQGSIKEWGLMLEINIPLQQTSRRAQEREALSMLAATQSRQEAVANQVMSDLSEALSGMDAARRTEQLTSDSLLPQAELTFNAALAGYENGKLDFSTLLDAQRQVRQAKQSLLKAQLESQTRLAEIEKLLGEEL